MTPASNEEGEKTLQGWYKLTKAFFELGDTLKQYLEKEMEKHHNHVKDRNKSTVPCRRCHSSMGRSQCEHCRSWRKIVEESVRKIWDCDNCTDYSCKKCRDRSKLPWRGTKPWDSYEDFKQFTILFTDGRYKDNRLQDIDALGLVLIMEHCKAFEHIDFEHYDEVIAIYSLKLVISIICYWWWIPLVYIPGTSNCFLCNVSCGAFLLH